MRFDEWETLTLQDVCTTITDGAHFSPKEEPSGLPMASVKDLTRFGIEVANCKRISQEDFDNLVRQNCAPQIGDVLIAKDGNSSLDTVCVFNQKDRLVLLSSVAILRPNEKITSDYLFYYLDSVETRRFLKENYRSGSAIPRIILRDFRRAPIPVPPIEVQKAIANVLRPLDEKIELNQQTNATLEAIAQAIFKEWFVHYNYPGATGDLVDRELGLIPAGWREKPLFDFADYINGAAYRNIDFSSDQSGLPVIKIAELKNGISQNTKFTTESLDSKYLLQTGDILFSWSGSPETSIDVFIWDGGDAWLNQHIFNVIPNQGFNKIFLYFLLRNQMPIFIETARNKQTTGLGHVTQKDLKRLKFVAPPEKLRQLFHAVVGPIFDKLLENNLQNRTLTDLRDVLLPKLMRGEIEV